MPRCSHYEPWSWNCPRTAWFSGSCPAHSSVDSLCVRAREPSSPVFSLRHPSQPQPSNRSPSFSAPQVLYSTSHQLSSGTLQASFGAPSFPASIFGPKTVLLLGLPMDLATVHHDSPIVLSTLDWVLWVLSWRLVCHQHWSLCSWSS